MSRTLVPGCGARQQTGLIRNIRHSIININAHREALTLGIRRGDEVFTLQLPVKWQVIAAEVQEESIAKESGIENGDILLTLNGALINKTTLDAQLMAAADQPLEIGLMRGRGPENK